jgi:pimeloyl-ACP methyl ester carboxylesterase
MRYRLSSIVGRRSHQGYRFDAARFRALATPTLLLLGGDSPSFFRAATEVIAATVPASRTVVLPGQQHTAMDTAPELLVREVVAFLKPHADGAPSQREIVAAERPSR